MPFPSWSHSDLFISEISRNRDLALQWRHNERDGVSNHLGIDCLLNCILGADQRKHQSPPSLAFMREIHRWPVDSPSQRTSNAKNVSIWWHHHDHYIYHGVWTRWLTHRAYFQMHFPEQKHNVCFGSCGNCCDNYSHTISSFKSRLLILWNKMSLFW